MANYLEEYLVYDWDLNDTDYEVVPPCTMLDLARVQRVLGPFVHSAICALGLVGNLLVVVTFSCYQRQRSMTDVYLLNVALADLLFVCLLPLLVHNELASWPMGGAACKLLRGAYSVNLYSGLLLLAAVSADRYLAIVHARRTFRLRSPRHARLACAAVWLLALLLALPTFLYYQRYQPGDQSHFTAYNLSQVTPGDQSHFTAYNLSQVTPGDQSDVTPGDQSPFTTYDQSDVMPGHSQSPFITYDQSQSSGPDFVCALRFSDPQEALHMRVLVPSVQMAVGFLLPLVVMVICYSSITATLLQARNFQRHRAVRVVVAVVTVFVACHLPYNLVLLYDTITMFQEHTCRAADALQVAKTLTETLAYLHCCLNPLLYAFVGVKFRSHFRKIGRDLWCLGKRYVTARRSSRLTSDFYFSSRRSIDQSTGEGSSFTM